MDKILTLIHINYLLDKRVLMRNHLSWLLHVILASSPVWLSFLVSQNRILVVTMLSALNYVSFSLIPSKIRPRLSLHKIKLYPISNAQVLKYLWITELIGCHALYLFVPFVGSIFLLSPSAEFIIYYLTLMIIFYPLLTLFVLELKFLITIFPILRGIIDCLFLVGYIVLITQIEVYTQMVTLGDLMASYFHWQIWGLILILSCMFLLLLYKLCSRTILKLTA